MTTLRVATCNILHGIDVRTGTVDLAATADALAALDADVVALQEVDRLLPRSGAIDQTAWLAERLGMHGTFAPAMLGDPHDRWLPPSGGADDDVPAYGVALLTRPAPVRSRRTRLPGGGHGRRRGEPSRNPGWDNEPRTALTAWLAHAGGTVAVTTTHLSYLPWRGARQLAVALASATGGDGPGPPSAGILAGDLNLPAAAVRLLAGSWRALPGLATYPAWDPRLQVDQVLLSGHATADRVETLPAGPSDHRPVVATVALTDAGSRGRGAVVREDGTST